MRSGNSARIRRAPAARARHIDVCRVPPGRVRFRGGTEALEFEARELGRSAGFAPTVVSAGIDLLLTSARRHDPGAAESLLSETVAAVATTRDWHEWLWRLRLCQVRAELALARGTCDAAVVEASEGINQSHTKGRPSLRSASGLITRAHALHGLGRTRDAIADARQGQGREHLP